MPVSELRTLVIDIVFGESPRWHEGRLWFSDWGAGEVVAVDLTGNREVIARVATFPFSIDWLPDGRLLILSSGLQRMETDGSLVSHGDLTHLAAAWNELVVDGRGNAYVNQAGFDPMAGAEPTSGTIALVTPHGSARQVAEGVWFPNGMATTVDGSTLIVAESYRSRLTAFDIDGDGGLSNRRVWADLEAGVPTESASMPKGPSGMPMYRTSTAFASPKAARCCKPSPSIAAASPALSAALKAGPCSSSPHNGTGQSTCSRANAPGRS